MGDAKDDDRAGRRSALGTLVTLGGIAYAGALLVPGARFLAASGATSAGGGRWIKVGRLDDLEPGVPRRLRVIGDDKDAFTLTKDQELGSCWVVRDQKGGVRALSATCPHLGCAVDLNADQKSFGCPCHTSRFTIDGSFESGPSPRGMDPLDARVDTATGAVEVNFRRYRQGISDREEVG